MVREDRSVWKARYNAKILRLFDEYSRCLIVTADNVGSRQMQLIRIALRGKGEVLMGKNTMIRRAIRNHLDTKPQLEKLLPHVVGNVGFIFTNGDLGELRNVVESNTKEAPAKAGAIAPIDVIVPKAVTVLGPEKTSFFQALTIATKITKGTIEILNDVHIIKKNEKVGASEAALLGMLKIYPFSYGLSTQMVYDNGTVYKPSVLDIKPSHLVSRFIQGIANVAAVSLQIGYPTVASVPHSVMNGFKNVAAVALSADIDFKELTKIKQILANPAAFAAPAAKAAEPVAPAKTEKQAAKPAPKEEPKPESDDDMGFGLFD